MQNTKFQSIRLSTALDPLGHNDDIQDDNDDPTGSNDNFWFSYSHFLALNLFLFHSYLSCCSL